MEFKIKQQSNTLRFASLFVVLFIIIAVFIIPNEEMKIFAGGIGACIWLIIFIAAWIISSVPTKLTVDSDVMKIQYPLGLLKINMSEITGLFIERYSVTHRAKYRGYYKEYRVRLNIYAGGKTIKLNDAASRKREGFTGLSIVYDELPDSDIPLYNAYEMLRYHTGIK